MDQGFRFTSRPYDIRERVLQFVVAITAIYPRKRALDRPSYRSWAQLFDSASSTGRHLEEANAGGTKRHCRSLHRGALREMREARYWLRVITAGKLEGWETLGELPREASELVAILTTIVKNSSVGDDEFPAQS